MDTQPDRCPRCGKPWTKLVRMPAGHSHAFRLECANPTCPRRFIRWIDLAAPTSAPLQEPAR